jgi:nitrite reductase/ring-hydroxylating ferredoxin subunit
MRSVVVARADEIGPGERKLVSVGGRSLGVFNVGGEYYAVRNRCPHQGGPLCEGFQFAPLRSDRPGSYERGPAGQIIRCPWHGWEFDLRTGRSWFDPQRTRVRSYRVDLRPPDAETYPTRQEGSYVVVELDG